ncbi:MAG: hypothetical protein ACTSPB_00305 [Candidatus Thorarchaeota archaeon]
MSEREIKEEKKEKSVSELREERMNTLCNAVLELEIVRVFGVRKSYVHVASELVNMARLVSDGRSDTGTMVLEGGFGVADKVKFFHSYRGDVGHWMMQLINTQKPFGWGEREEFIKTVNEVLLDVYRGKSNMMWFFRRIQNKFLSEVVMSNMFFNRHDAWSVKQGNMMKSKDREDRQASLIARNLYAFILDSKIDRDIKIPQICAQIEEYLEFGKVLFEKYPEIVPRKFETQPRPLLTVGEGSGYLVWNFGKYCPKCGTLKEGCFCVDATEHPDGKFDMCDDYQCWSCREKSLIRALTKKGDKSDDDSLASFEIEVTESLGQLSKKEFKEFKKEVDKYLILSTKKDDDDSIVLIVNITHKKLTKKQAEEYINYVNEFSEGGDYEPPEDMCSCPLE